MNTKSGVCLLTLFLVLLGARGAPLGTAFSYQGRLTDGGNPANGAYDLQLILYGADIGGSQVGNILTNENVTVSNGLFTTELDFGANIFTGDVRWLEIGVRPGSSTGSFTPLSPRQQLTPAPYALYAPTAGSAASATTAATATSVPWSAIASLPPGFADGVDNDTTYSASTGLNLTGTIFSLNSAYTDTLYWKLGGNTSAAPGANFLGTTDNQPLEFKVNNGRALRLEPTTNSPNVIGGYSGNFVAAGVYGATIGGGGTPNLFESPGPALTNFVGHANFATISGGQGNRVGVKGTNTGVIAVSGAVGSVIGGGSLNTIQDFGDSSTIGGGFQNEIVTSSSTIGGGVLNTIGFESDASTISGGLNNTIQTYAMRSTIGGGRDNTIQASARYSTIPGGQENVAGGEYSFAAGRRANANHAGSFVWGDASNTDIASSATNQFTVRASGGVRFFSNANASTGVQLAAGDTGWSAVSDRNLKENFQAVDGLEVLRRVAALPIQSWNMKTQDPAIRHIGPMAQDFQAAFHLSEDDKHINSVDADGVALAAIQGLNQKLEEKETRIEALEKTVAELKTLIRQLADARKGGNP